jgi:hypothetical protein
MGNEQQKLAGGTAETKRHGSKDINNTTQIKIT